MIEIAPTAPRHFSQPRSILGGVRKSLTEHAARVLRSWDSSPRSGGLLAVFLVVVLLLCHGILGFAHQTSCHAVCEATDPLQSSLSIHGAHGSGEAGGHAVDGPAGAPDGGQGVDGYFAVLLALFGAALLGLLLGARGRYETIALRPHRPRSLLAFACLPRGPTLPRLQVFRL